MADVLIFWRDYRHNVSASGDAGAVSRWHSNSKIIRDLAKDDRVWLVTSGKALSLEPPEAGFLVAIWRVSHAEDNSGDSIAYPQEEFRYRVHADTSRSRTLSEPVNVDKILRGSDKDPSIPIGRLLQGPRRLKEEIVRALVERSTNE